MIAAKAIRNQTIISIGEKTVSVGSAIEHNSAERRVPKKITDIERSFLPVRLLFPSLVRGRNPMGKTVAKRMIPDQK